MNKLRVKVKNLDETLDFARSLGGRLRGGEVIELVSDMGGGKTTFVRGLADGIRSKDHVHSPSFTLSNQYRSADNRLIVNHFDLHRLSDAGIIKRSLAEIISEESGNIVVIEWADTVKDILPEDRLTIVIKVINTESREFDISYPDRLKYLL